jgi:hypothetical protein
MFVFICLIGAASIIISVYSTLVATEILIHLATLCCSSNHHVDSSSVNYKRMVLFLRLTYSRAGGIIVALLGGFVALQFIKLQNTLRKAYSSQFYYGYAYPMWSMGFHCFAAGYALNLAATYWYTLFRCCVL